MRVLLVDGMRGPSPLVDDAIDTLAERGHEVHRLDLEAEGFDRFMSEEERRAYHEADNLVTDAQRRSAALVGSVDALLVISALRSGTIDPIVKSWFERVFIPGVSFTFTEGGRITGALTNIRRVGMVVLSPDDDPRRHRRSSSTRSVVRAVRLNAHKLCRTTYVALTADTDTRTAITRALSRW